jgi:hypothetical protein
MSTGNIAENNLEIWNRALELLAAGDYQNGFEEFAIRWSLFPRLMSAKTQQWAQWLPYWKGEEISGKRLLLLAEQGFGDTIMMLRYVPVLLEMGADVWLDVPVELERLAGQLAPIARVAEADYVCALFDVMRALRETPATIPCGRYLVADEVLKTKWRERIGDRRIGVVWSSLCKYPGEDARSMALEEFVALVPAEPGELVALQAHDVEAARAAGICVIEGGDFADVAAVAALMDRVITIDTAAVHVASAIGHPDVSVLLPHAANWRWGAGNPWYPDVKLCRQQAPGDWASAFAQIEQVQEAAA